jgi:multidrug resistance protein
MTHRRIIPFFLIIATIENFSSEIILPSFPAMQHTLSVNKSAIEFTLTCFLFGFSVSPIFLGPLSDRVGRRKVLLGALSAFWVASLMLYLSCDISTVYLGRFIQGLASGGFFVVNQAMIRETNDKTMLPKVTSYIAITWASVSLLSPLLGGFLQTHFSWRANFLFIMLYVSVVSILMYRFLPETINKKSNKLSFQGVWADILVLLKTPIFIRPTLLATMTYSLIYIFYTISPFLFQQQLGLTVLGYAWVLFFAGLAYLIGAFFNTLGCHLISLNRRLRVGLYGIGLSVILFAIDLIIFPSCFWAVLMPLISMICFSGFIFPNTLAIAMGSQKLKLSTTSATYCCIQFLGCTIASFFVTQFSVDHFNTIAFLMLFIVFCFPFVFQRALCSVSFEGGRTC